ncbi:MAG: homoserine O-acetyltransferase [Synergistaceae bacterium]|jgi:homoserine O-acetyltransferase|nr:homoserine O-acetyltransferase [Synergistaceae bacterium]
MAEKYECITIADLTLQSKEVLSRPRVVCSVNGTPNPDGSNVIVICHALTGSHHVTGAPSPGLPDAWWEDVVGPGRAIDTDRFCVVCCCNLCSPYGSSAPTDIDPATGRPIGMSFPVISPRDVARSQRAALNALGINRIAGVVGGSLGGMIALEWAASFPDTMDFCVAIAAPALMYPQAAAFNIVQRRSITTDPDWKDGDYYPDRGPMNGLSNARMLAMITYRSEESFINRRATAQNGEVEGYLMYHGEEITRRFDANCYLHLTRMMDLHDISDGRGDIEAAFEGFRGNGKRFLAVGINSDILFPAWQVRELFDAAVDAGVNASYREIKSDVGHDAFLVETERMSEILREFLG